MLGTNQICLLYPEFIITRLDNKVNMDLGMKNLKESVCCNREFVITGSVLTELVITKFVITEFVIIEFVITKFVITKFVIAGFVITKIVITKFVITKFVMTKFQSNLSNGISLSLCKSDDIKQFRLKYILLLF